MAEYTGSSYISQPVQTALNLKAGNPATGDLNMSNNNIVECQNLILTQGVGGGITFQDGSVQSTAGPTGPAGNPSGPTNSVQYNNGVGGLGGSSNMLYDDSVTTLTLNGTLQPNTINFQGGVAITSVSDFIAIGNAAGGGSAVINSGTIEPTFYENMGSGFGGGYVLTIGLDASANIIVGGTFTSYDGSGCNGIIKLRPDGTIDQTFYENMSSGFGSGGSVSAIGVDASANIIVGGNFTSYDGSGCSDIIKLRPDGTIDKTFYENMGSGIGIVGVGSYVKAIGVDASANIIVGGNFTSYDGSGCSDIIKIRPDGTIDQPFYENMGQGIRGGAGIVNAIGVDASANIIVGGNFTSYDGSGCNGIIKLQPDGTIDQTFYENMSSGFDGVVYAIGVDASANIIVGGLFTSYDGSACSNIIKLRPDGTIDPTFYENMGSGIGGFIVFAIGTDASANIIVGGEFTSYDSSACSNIIKLRSDGTIDTTFYENMGSGIDTINGITGYVLSIRTDASANIIVGGNYTSYDGSVCNRIVKLVGNTKTIYYNQQLNAIAIGSSAGNISQRSNAIAIGAQAGYDRQGQYAIAIGYQAGQTSQAANSIILNATDASLNSTTTNALFVKPIRNDNTQTQALCWNTRTSEITYSTSGTKTFVIDHPTKTENYLVHACLEGPEAGVYYRGKATIEAKMNFVEITLPAYVNALATEFTVHLTPVISEENDNAFVTLATSNVQNGRFKVYRKKTQSFWGWLIGKKASPQLFDYVVFGKRAAINVEPMKAEVEVKGQGPYKWL